MVKTSFITGVTGQDGLYLSQLLLGKGYEVHGMQLYGAEPQSDKFSALKANPHFHLHYGDLTDSGNIWRLLSEIQPDEVYNLGAQSHVGVSFKTPEATADINALGTLRLLEAIRGLNLTGKTRFYQASSSELFGNAPAPQNEQTPMHPCSPYGAAKLFAYWQVRIYREAYGLHASNGILFNHESPERGPEFVTRKISRAVAAIEAGREKCLSLGNLDARRDWGHAADYVEGMWLMLQQETPGDFVLATGETRSVRDFCEKAFRQIGIDLTWDGSGIDEKGIDKRSGRVVVTVDPQFFRPAELHSLIGKSTRARKTLGWQPKHNFQTLVREMVSHDRQLLQQAGNFEPTVLAAE